MQTNTHYKPTVLFVPVARRLSVKAHRSLMLSNLRVPMDRSFMGRFHGCGFFFPRRTLLHVYWRTKCHSPARSGVQSGGHLQVGDACCKASCWCCASRCPVRPGWPCSVCLDRAERQQNKGCQKSAFFIVYFKRENGLDKESNCHRIFWMPCTCIWDWVRQGIALFCGKTYSCFFQFPVF